jgi:hypothetical protein
VLGELTRDARTRYIPPSSFVEAHTGPGDFDQAFQAMEPAYAEHSNFVRILKVNPVVDPRRKDPRFAEYLRRIGLE